MKRFEYSSGKHQQEEVLPSEGGYKNTPVCSNTKTNNGLVGYVYITYLSKYIVGYVYIYFYANIYIYIIFRLI